MSSSSPGAACLTVDGGRRTNSAITRRVIWGASRASPPATATPPKGLDELTARELEVFKLVARGLSNAEIAAELIVSETTVKTHVARILMKLRLRDRVQAVVYAYEHGVVQAGDGAAGDAN